MKSKYLNYMIIPLIIASIYINFMAFFGSKISSYKELIVTIIYLLGWGMYIFKSKSNNKNLVFAVLYSLITMISGFVLLALNYNPRMMVDFIIPFAIISITPLYGLNILSSYSSLVFSIIVILLCIVSTLISIRYILLNKEKRW